VPTLPVLERLARAPGRRPRRAVQTPHQRRIAGPSTGR
jgi:hypothetical protein